MSTMTDKMSESGSGNAVTASPSARTPKKGDRFRCAQCGMEIQLTADCRCPDPNHVHFHCCGQQLRKV